MNVAIETLGLTKTYRTVTGRVIAADRLDLRIPARGLHVLLGPAKSGKSTLLRLLVGLAWPDAGAARVLGVTAPDTGRELAGRMGAVIGEPDFIDRLSGQRNLLMHPAATSKAQVDLVLKQAGLANVAQDAVGSYTLGGRRRLAIAAGLLAGPDLLLVDDATRGLDPAGTREVRTLLRKLADRGPAVVLAGDNLVEAQQIADTVTLLSGGRALADGPASDVIGSVATSVRVRVDDAQRAVDELTAAKFTAKRDGPVVVVDGVAEPAEVTKVLARKKLYVTEMSTQAESLAALVERLTPEPEPKPDEPSRAERRAARKAAAAKVAEAKKKAEDKAAANQAAQKEEREKEEQERTAAREGAVATAAEKKAAAKEEARLEKIAVKERAESEKVAAKKEVERERAAAKEKAGREKVTAKEMTGHGGAQEVEQPAVKEQPAEKKGKIPAKTPTGKGSAAKTEGAEVEPAAKPKPGSTPKPPSSTGIESGADEEQLSWRERRRAAFEADVAAKRDAYAARVEAREQAAAKKEEALLAKKEAQEEREFARLLKAEDKAARKEERKTKDPEAKNSRAGKTKALLGARAGATQGGASVGGKADVGPDAGGEPDPADLDNADLNDESGELEEGKA